LPFFCLLSLECQRWKVLYETVGPDSFDHQKKFAFNPMRKMFPLDFDPAAKTPSKAKAGLKKASSNPSDSPKPGLKKTGLKKARLTPAPSDPSGEKSKKPLLTPVKKSGLKKATLKPATPPTPEPTQETKPPRKPSLKRATLKRATPDSETTDSSQKSDSPSATQKHVLKKAKESPSSSTSTDSEIQQND
ncbi:MAG: hypothetical protein AAFR59_09330, partial [Bacteroidota bacterium]